MPLRRWKPLLVALSLAALAACAPGADGAGDPSAAFERTPIALAGDGARVELDAYVADTPELRQRGLMGWESLPERSGMLFVFAEDSHSGFWMKDTLLPLSIAFAGADGRVHTILDMEPCRRDPCPRYAPDAPYRYALEVEQGTFEELGVTPGWRLDLDSYMP